MGSTKKKLYELVDAIREFLLVARLWLPDAGKQTPKRVIPVIASMTSHPPRIGLAWIAIETLLRQSVRPEKLLLVLSEEEFPDKLLPRKIRSQTRRGLEILWVPVNGKSYDKLIPVLEKFPDKAIVTFDDDKFFPAYLLVELFDQSLAHPGIVVGARGWVIQESESGIRYGDGWVRAEAGCSGRNILTPGGNGCLYPPGSLDHGVKDLRKALAICPTADDIWFWAATQKTGTRILCLGFPAHRPVGCLKSSVALSQTNRSNNDDQFQKALDYWGIRKSVAHSVRQDNVSVD